MSLLHLDFPSGQPGIYGTTVAKMLDGLYAENGSATLVDDPEPLITGNVLRVSDVSPFTGIGFRRVLPSAQDTVGLAARFYLDSLPDLVGRLPRFFEWRNNENECLCYLQLDTTGTLSLYSAAGSSGSGSWRINGTLLGQSTSPVIVASAWQHVEAKLTSHASAGTFELRVEGEAVDGLTLTGLNTAGGNTPTAIAQYVTGCIPQASSVKPFYIKDWKAWDTNGTEINDFMGTYAVHELIPNGDRSLNWSVSTGSTGYDLIDEAPPVDTDYIYADTGMPAPAVVELTNLPANVTSVKGLITIARGVKSDGGDGNLQVGLVSNGDTGLGADRPMTTAPTYWQDVQEVDPDTGATWLPAAVNAVGLQFDRTV